MLGDKNWDEREGDSYKTTHSALSDLVGGPYDKDPASYLFWRGDGFTFSVYLLTASGPAVSAFLFR